MNARIVYKWLLALSMLASTVTAQTTLYFRISAPGANTEILNLHEWGVLVWSNQIPFSTSSPSSIIQSCTTLDGPWTVFTNGYPFVGYSNMYSQIVRPELAPTNFLAGGIAVGFDQLLSYQEQADILSSYGLSGSPAWEGIWVVTFSPGPEVEWCAILECNPYVLWAGLTTPIPEPFKKTANNGLHRTSHYVRRPVSPDVRSIR